MKLTELYLRAFLVTRTEDEEENLIKQVLKDQEIAEHVRKIGGKNTEIIDRSYLEELKVDAKKWNDLDDVNSKEYFRILNNFSNTAGDNHKIVERVKEYKAQLELLLRLNDKVEDTSKLTIVGLAAVRDTINGLQKCMVGKNE